MKILFLIATILAVAVADTPYKLCQQNPVCVTTNLQLPAKPMKGAPIGIKWELQCGKHEFITNLHVSVNFDGYDLHDHDSEQHTEIDNGKRGSLTYNLIIPKSDPPVNHLSFISLYLFVILGCLPSQAHR